jgi:hypothetical protein
MPQLDRQTLDPVHVVNPFSDERLVYPPVARNIDQILRSPGAHPSSCANSLSTSIRSVFAVGLVWTGANEISKGPSVAIAGNAVRDFAAVQHPHEFACIEGGYPDAAFPVHADSIWLPPPKVGVNTPFG